jgi:phage/plasmid-associated DNA primase
VKLIICNNDEKIYNYLQDWVAFIVQNPGRKNKTAFIIIGGFGSGKNTFTDVLIKLFKRYSSNFENLESAVGKFNSAIENIMLGVFNELVSVDNRKFMNYDGLKQLETGETFTINEKCIPERTAENVINNIYLSNHRIPFKLDENDRRYIVLETNNKYAKGSCSDEERAEYFNSLYDSFEGDFYDNLLTYYMKRDISKYKPFIIPDTDIKNDIISASKDSVQAFVEDHSEMLAAGCVCGIVYERYVEFCKANGFMVKKSTTFGGEMGAYCEHKQKRVNGEKNYHYTLKSELVKKYLSEK